MTIQVTREDFTFDNLVNLFSTATYGSNWLGMACESEPSVKYECREDNWAQAWLEGSPLCFMDYYADGDSNRSEGAPEIVGDFVDKDNCNVIIFKITLDQAIQSLNWAMSNAEYKNSISKSVQMWLSEDDSFDLCVADSIVQAIMFGDEVYG